MVFDMCSFFGCMWVEIMCVGVEVEFVFCNVI